MIHYSTPPRRIGQHDWRMVVYDSPRGYGRVTDYQFRDTSGAWCPETAWPTYNADDGVYAGCPKRLRNIWRDHQTDIEAALAGPAAAPQQLDLF